MEKTHDQLLADAVRAHEEFVITVEEARMRRQVAFRAATTSTVTGREIAEATGLSESTVSAIKAGKY